MKYFYIFLLVLVPELSLACFVERELTDELKSHADIVFQGEAINYSSSKLGKNGLEPAEITFRVDKVLKGPKLSVTSAKWVNGTFGESSNLTEFKKDYGKKITVGLITSKALARITECKKVRSTNEGTGEISIEEDCTTPLIAGEYRKKEESDKNWVVQGACTPPFLLSINNE